MRPNESLADRNTAERNMTMQLTLREVALIYIDRGQPVGDFAHAIERCKEDNSLIGDGRSYRNSPEFRAKNERMSTIFQELDLEHQE